MASAATESSEPVRLHLPAILQNPTNRSVRQVAAHNAQQREKAAAKREHREAEATAHGGRGKRYVRRKDNGRGLTLATFAANPHIVQPSKGDFTPPVPLHHRRVQASFPPSVVPRSTEAPSSEPPVKDPFSQDSHHGAFSTSLKGTRALLRKRGRRAEVVVGNVERELRGWLAGEGWDAEHEDDALSWLVVDGELVDCSSAPVDPSSSTPPPASVSRRMPTQHQIRVRLPCLPVENGKVASIMELSRSPAHLTWAIAEGFERMVVHLVARYYEVISWNHLTADDQPVRLTHIILPSLAQAKAPPAGHSLITPDTTDISDLSAPSSSDRDTDTSTDLETDSDSDAGTEVGYSLDEQHDVGDTSIATVTAHDIAHVTEEVSHLDLNPLERVPSNTSSMYASSEGGSEFGMGDSMTLPPRPVNGGWTAVTYSDAESDFGDVSDVPFPRRLGGLEANPVVLGRVGARGWQEKPTFFEYLYGA